MFAGRYEENVPLHGQIEFLMVGFSGSECHSIGGIALYGIGGVCLQPKSLHGLTGCQTERPERLVRRVLIVGENRVEGPVGSTHRGFAT